jgi:hypothetical protein
MGRSRFTARSDKFEAMHKAEAAGETADSLEVRRALLERVDRGELTLEAAQVELRRIQRGAKKAGKITRSDAFRRG